MILETYQIENKLSFDPETKEIEIIHRLFLVIAMYCQASSMNR